MKKLRIGILDLLHDTPAETGGYGLYRNELRRQFVSIMPQTISVWCRGMGHEVFYKIYYGQQAPESLLPDDLDYVFVTAYTQAAMLSYALAKLFKRRGVVTVLGGPHAKAFPDDSLRFFDHVVLDCDKQTIQDILSNQFRPGDLIDTGKALTHIPGVQARMPELMSTTLRRRMAVLRVVPVLSSVGCPYTCNFCSDADSSYQHFPAEELRDDLKFVAQNIKNAFVTFHDPNFGVRFDDTMQALETLPPHQQPAYGVQATLSVLKESRMKRLYDTGCVYVAPGVESWEDFGDKSGNGKKLRGREKLDKVLQQFEMMHRYVDGFQANFVFGTDADKGSEIVDLTSEFIQRAPYAWPGISIPTPFGNTGIFRDYLSQGRVLESMPFALYYKPYLSFIPLHYSAIEYYEHLIRILSTAVSWESLVSRVTMRGMLRVKALYLVQMSGVYNDLKRVKEIHGLIKAEKSLQDFHDGSSQQLPAYYKFKLKQRLGNYYNLFSNEELVPRLTGQASASKMRQVSLLP